jgi:hypothetical protein
LFSQCLSRILGQWDVHLADGEIHDRTCGLSHPFRGRWTPIADGRVRQFFEEQQENEWQRWFEGFYSKVVE